MGYLDEGGKYSLEINCKIVKEQTNLDTFEKGKEITIIGVVKDYKVKSKNKPNSLYIKNCFAEQ